MRSLLVPVAEKSSPPPFHRGDTSAQRRPSPGRGGRSRRSAPRADGCVRCGTVRPAALPPGRPVTRIRSAT